MNISIYGYYSCIDPAAPADSISGHKAFSFHSCGPAAQLTFSHNHKNELWILPGNPGNPGLFLFSLKYRFFAGKPFE